MPFEHGTYFTAADERKTRAFLAGLGLSPRQETQIRAWHRSRLSAQLSLWSSVAAAAGIALGYFLAGVF
ncbi:hypothetical protein K3722_04770 [Leisingera caerulea]|uniref:Uncharacterized protein n=1 Tax=Leisingera caerulea TaxID=506591 RepID=A0A9Q9HKW7_LEICA|nr:hypothetical protein [Leisingera caerulea]UWQ50745.1 hypothetical protein K3720_04900 [Leisingera caerulea]UWQ54814.1 hypothetical protein K3721_04600 [Leisingera caerulea]UWQ59441.1 hypothetical protein K3722_04770 [Leisingera caerulea]UWQ63567.1 hypothetical protein K3723_04560 [Leisingera caerulea]UWQ84469.1 hypothetical protein K3726_04535 [Leisingera caerulea]